MKCFSVSGHVNRPGNFEVPLGTPFRDLLELAGGVRGGRRLKAVIPGGSSVPPLPGDAMMDVDMDYDSIREAGSLLGSGAVVVMDETTSMVSMLRRIARFYYAESCGQCTPCREGTGWLYRVLCRIERGEARQEELDMLVDVADNIEGRTICALGDAAAWPVQGFLRHFRDEFQYHIDHGAFPPGVAGVRRRREVDGHDGRRTLASRRAARTAAAPRRIARTMGVLRCSARAVNVARRNTRSACSPSYPVAGTRHRPASRSARILCTPRGGADTRARRRGRVAPRSPRRPAPARQPPRSRWCR